MVRRGLERQLLADAALFGLSVYQLGRSDDLGAGYRGFVYSSATSKVDSASD